MKPIDTLGVGWALLLVCSACSAPEPSPPAPSDEMRVLVRMEEEQQRDLTQRLEAFGAEVRGPQIRVETFGEPYEGAKDQSGEELAFQLAEDRRQGTIGVAKVYIDWIVPLLEQDFFLPLAEIEGVEEGEVAGYLSSFLPRARRLGVNRAGEQVLVPRKLETNVVAYRRSKVEAAARGWREYEAGIRRMFSEGEGGLPRRYELESNPGDWDWFDLAVAGYYWRETEGGGRLAHRSAEYFGTMNEIAAKIFQAGGDQDALLLGGGSDEVLRRNREAVLDAFHWEAFLRSNGLYQEAMFEREWKGDALWTGLATGQVFFCFVHQLDAFQIDKRITGEAFPRGDIGYTTMPQGASLDDPSRRGRSYSQLGGWWWGIPRSTPDAGLSYRLVRLLTDPEVLEAEARQFGFIPPVEPLYENLDRDPRPWAAEVFQTSRRQFELGVIEMPQHPFWPQIQKAWLRAWTEIVRDAQYSPEPAGTADRRHIARVLEESYFHEIQFWASQATVVAPPGESE